MISKVSGYGSFQRVAQEKDRIRFIKEANEKSQKISPEEKIEQDISKNPQDSQNRDFFIAEYYRTLPQRLRIINAKAQDNDN